MSGVSSHRHGSESNKKVVVAINSGDAVCPVSTRESVGGRRLTCWSSETRDNLHYNNPVHNVRQDQSFRWHQPLSGDHAGRQKSVLILAGSIIARKLVFSSCLGASMHPKCQSRSALFAGDTQIKIELLLHRARGEAAIYERFTHSHPRKQAKSCQCCSSRSPTGTRSDMSGCRD